MLEPLNQQIVHGFQVFYVFDVLKYLEDHLIDSLNHLLKQKSKQRLLNIAEETDMNFVKWVNVVFAYVNVIV